MSHKRVDNVIGRFGRVSLVVVLMAGLSGCGGLRNDVLNSEFWAASPFISNSSAELGIAALARGNYVTAESHFQNALKKNPRDIDALLGAGLLYQNTNQRTKARQMYEAVIALHPDDSYQFVVWTDIKTRPASEIASVNLALMESGGIAQTMNAIGAPGQGISGAMVQASSGMPLPSANMASAYGVSATPTASPMLGRTMVQKPQPLTSPAPMLGQFSSGDNNLVSRFSTIRALRDQGLITGTEYQVRRNANIGGLLPLTSPPPAEGLSRPVPTSERISGRLRAIGRALEMRAITLNQHSSERMMILDALMPSAPVVVARPAIPPKGLMQAADAVRRLEKLRDAGFISSDEYARERLSIERSMQPPPGTGAMGPATMAAPVSTVEKALEMKPTGPQPGIHLASYRSQKQADRGWAQIKRANKALIGDLDYTIVKVRLGRKGTYYRLKAGPVADQSEAKSLCRKLKRRRQYCEPTTIDQG